MQALIVITAVLAASAQAGAGPVVVLRAVDSTWAPLPGVASRIVEVRNCENLVETTAVAQEQYTRADGTTEFRVRKNTAYMITIQSPGFESQRTCIRSNSSTAYLQLRMRLDPSRYVKQTIPGSVQKSGRDQLVLGDLVGVYADEKGRSYEVAVSDSGEGVTVSFADGTVLMFPSRDGTTFKGPEGIVRFERSQGRIAMTLTPSVVKALQADVP